MKRFVISVLSAVGLVPARRYKEMSQRVATLSRDREDWKKRARKAARRERVAVEQAHALERQLRKQDRRFAVVADQRSVELKALEEQLADAQRALALMREHLMAIEVKMQILEGAANVLDARTRAQISGSTAAAAARTSASA